jgi:hypothetical protein
VAAETRLAALAGEIAIWGMCTFFFFAHLGYDITVYAMVGLMAALGRAAQREAALLAAEPAPDDAPKPPATAPARWRRRR